MGYPYSSILQHLEGNFDKVVFISFKIGEKLIECDFCPRRLLYLDGELALLGEDCHERRITQVDISSIISIHETGKGYEENFSSIEFDDYIMAIRAVSESATRLILKIKNLNNLDLTPKYQFIGNPYLTQTGNGDYIWGATLDENETLFEWLYSIRDRVEIYDPENLKEKFTLYNEKRNSINHGLKKVS